MEEDYYGEYTNSNMKLEKYNDYLRKSNYLNEIAEDSIARGKEIAGSKRNWRGAKEIARKQALERGAIERGKLLVGYKAVDGDFNATLGSVRARDVQQVKGWLEAKGLRAEWVFELHAGESMEQFDDKTAWLRHDYENVKASYAKNRSLSQAQELADKWLADQLRELDEKRAAAKELEGIDPAKGYTSSVDPRARKVIAKHNAPNQFTAPLIAMRTITLASAGLFGDFIANAMFGVPEFGLGAAVLGLGSLGVHAIVYSDLKDVAPTRARVIESSLELERASLRLWLHARYGISVSRDVLAELAEAVHGTENPFPFEAEDGRYFKFMKVADTEGWFVFETAPPASESFKLVYREKVQGAIDRASGALSRAQEILESKPTQPLFSGEVALLHERIQQMLALLDQQPLTTEEQHVVARCKQDVAATASTLQALAALGDRESGQKRAADVLGQLVEELNELVNGKKAALLTELDVQRTYVSERRRSTGGRLELIKPQAQLEPAQEQEATQ